MIKNLGIPYMGSKRKLAPQIIDYILEHNPNCKFIYDLFGGGGSISFEAIQRPQIKNVHYNEFDSGVVALLEKIRNEGVTPEFYEWIDRETFFKLKDGKDWKAGLIKTCWSFGNRGATYLFGTDIEEPKRLLHEIVVNKCEKSLITINNLLNIDIDKSILELDTIKSRRLKLQSNIKYLAKNYNPRIGEQQQLAGVEKLKELEPILRPQQLERIDKLQQLQQLQISNLSYEQVDITTPIEETIIYLDPPYENTEDYQNSICHKTLLDYIKNSKYKIYVSSYEFDLPCVLEMEHRSLLSSINNNLVIEKLFCNKVENKTFLEELLDL